MSIDHVLMDLGIEFLTFKFYFIPMQQKYAGKYADNAICNVAVL